MVKDHSDSEKGNPLPPHRLLLSINTYHGLCFTSRGALAGTSNSLMGPPHEGSIRRPIAPWANALPLSNNNKNDNNNNNNNNNNN